MRRICAFRKSFVFRARKRNTWQGITWPAEVSPRGGISRAFPSGRRSWTARLQTRRSSALCRSVVYLKYTSIVDCRSDCVSVVYCVGYSLYCSGYSLWSGYCGEQRIIRVYCDVTVVGFVLSEQTAILWRVDNLCTWTFYIIVSSLRVKYLLTCV